MRLPSLSRCRLVAASLVVLLTAGCGPAVSPASVKSTQEIQGPPDFVKTAKTNPRWHAYQLRAFQLNHAWSGSGYQPHEGDAYRAKITLWDYPEDGSAIAELYFHDAGNTPPTDPDPANARRPYQIHFPMGAIGPILQALRNSNEPVYLYYYEEKWAVGISQPEPVGVD